MSGKYLCLFVFIVVNSCVYSPVNKPLRFLLQNNLSSILKELLGGSIIIRIYSDSAGGKVSQFNP